MYNFISFARSFTTSCSPFLFHIFVRLKPKNAKVVPRHLRKIAESAKESQMRFVVKAACGTYRYLSNFGQTKRNMGPLFLDCEVFTLAVFHHAKRAMCIVDSHKELAFARCHRPDLSEGFPSPLGVVARITLDVFKLVSVNTPGDGFVIEPITVVSIQSRLEELLVVGGVVMAEINISVFNSPNIGGAA